MPKAGVISRSKQTPQSLAKQQARALHQDLHQTPHVYLVEESFAAIPSDPQQTKHLWLSDVSSRGSVPTSSQGLGTKFEDGYQCDQLVAC